MKGKRVVGALISIIVPVYNVGRYLKKCIDSICTQTYDNLQIVLVDDGSIDSSELMCDEYAKNDERIAVIHKENGGQSEARNYGIDNASGEYICFVDSDDFANHNMIKILYEAIKNDNSDIACCGYASINTNDVVQNNFIKSAILDKKEALEMLSLGIPEFSIVWNKLYRSSLFENLRFEVGKLHEDEYIIHRILGQCRKISTIEDNLYYYLVRDGSISHGNSKIEHIDKAYAYIDRYNYFLEKGYHNLLQNVTIQCYGVMIDELSKHNYNRHKDIYKPVVVFIKKELKSCARVIKLNVWLLKSIVKTI